MCSRGWADVLADLGSLVVDIAYTTSAGLYPKPIRGCVGWAWLDLPLTIARDDY